MDAHNHQTCLGIPVPLSVKALAKAPPICLPSRADCETIEILENLGNLFGRPKDEIKQAQNLAAGLSDIVIILQRPRDRYYHPYDVGFDEFVKTCPTLQAVDQLIRFATRGARSIHTTTVLDAFSYQPDKKATKQDQKCHEALARILKIKTPKVILRCHRDGYRDEWLKCIEQKGEDYKLERKEISITEDSTTVILQSFHPSCAVNNADCRPEYRALLTYHFVAAFSELHSEFKLPETAKDIEKLCALRGERRDIPNYEQWEAASRISKMLKEKYEGPSKMGFVRVVHETAYENRIEQIKEFKAMYGSLSQLFGELQEPGGLAIAKTVLFLWKNHFQTDPLYQHIMSWLILRGNEQKDWLPCERRLASDARPLEEQISGLEISQERIFNDIKAINNEAKLLAERASETIIRGEGIGDELRSHMAKILENHNACIWGYLEKTSMSDISNAMHISALLSQCKIFLSALTKDDSLEDKDLDSLIRCLDQLASVFKDHDA
ncbi:hypothetical protein BJX68DRAFT_277864 [Aspergillus pseudodeflectus]|uniref:Uncharacterized protein n=1 Tax=Aspergillus pseudodeflectus TaxID=176178 RepID=A0ABR4JWT2_9EURO